MTRYIRFLGVALISFIVYSCSGGDAGHRPENLYLEVNPMIGTDWVGNTYPGASVPFGMVQLSPDNGLPGWDRISGYFYPDSTIAGFSHTHLSGTGAGDLYDVSFLPILEPALQDSLPLGIHARFRHETEQVHAGYYAVTLEPYDIRVELTATEHCGVQAYTFARSSDSACIILNLHKAMNWDRTLSSGLVQVDSVTLLGFRHSDGWARGQQLFFRTQLSRSPDHVQIDSIALPMEQGASFASYGHVARLYYKVEAGEQIVLATAISGVSQEGAEKNMKEEIGKLDFDLYRRQAEEKWEDKLSRIIVQEENADKRAIFYSALYHSMLCPTLYSDVDGHYRGPDGKIHHSPNPHYSTFSLWDTYRTAHPLYTLIASRESRDMVESLLAFGEQNEGYMPVWNMHASETDMMIGYHSVPVVVEAILKEIYPLGQGEERRRQAERISGLFRTTAERRGYRGLDDYRRLGYVPADTEEESLSKTMEYSYDDAAILAWAEWIGDEALYNSFSRRAQNYRHLWDTTTQFFRPRLSDGHWLAPFDPFSYTADITESNAYQYLFSAQHDAEGLLALMGGTKGLAQRLDEFFSLPTPSHIELPIFSTGMIGQYAHGNEPGHHVPYLYNVARRPWRTTDIVHDICNRLYTAKPDGLCGNEDCGQMSAWYVMSAIGLYPLDPVSLRYELVSPLYPRVEMSLPGGKSFVIEAKGWSKTSRYIRRVWLNGEEYNHSYILHKDIVAGGKLVLEMTSQKGICWY